MLRRCNVPAKSSQHQRFFVDKTPSRMLCLDSGGATRVAHGCSLTSALRAAHVYERRSLGLACGLCCYRRRCTPRPMGNRPRERPIHVRHCLSCRCGLHSALRDYHDNRTGDLRLAMSLGSNGSRRCGPPAHTDPSPVASLAPGGSGTRTQQEVPVPRTAASEVRSEVRKAPSRALSQHSAEAAGADC
jgi:hypothetical protein